MFSLSVCANLGVHNFGTEMYFHTEIVLFHFCSVFFFFSNQLSRTQLSRLNVGVCIGILLTAQGPVVIMDSNAQRGL